MFCRVQFTTILGFFSLLFGLWTAETGAQPMPPRHQDPSYKSICEAHTDELEQAFDLPAGLLKAITRVETGRPNAEGIRLGWPWSINHDGKGLFFDSKKDMLAYARQQIAAGNTRMDIGCMQISLFWHGDQFADLEDMADPSSNIAYAAAFLADLKARHGSFDQAIRHYHNADPAQNTPYVARVYDAWEHIVGDSELTLANTRIGNADLPNTASYRAGMNPANHTPPAKSEALYTQVSAAPQQKPTAPAAAAVPADPLAGIKARQPHLHGRWDKVLMFRQMLKP